MQVAVPFPIQSASVPRTLRHCCPGVIHLAITPPAKRNPTPDWIPDPVRPLLVSSAAHQGGERSPAPVPGAQGF